MIPVNDLLDKITIQWLAGFFDGEGCVSASYNNNHFYFHVHFTQKDTTLLVLIKIKFPQFNLKLEKDGIHLRVCGKEAKPLLEALKDHVVKKKDQIELGLKIIKLLQNDNSRLSDDEKNLRKIYVQELSNNKIEGIIQ